MYARLSSTRFALSSTQGSYASRVGLIAVVAAFEFSTNTNRDLMQTLTVKDFLPRVETMEA